MLVYKYRGGDKEIFERDLDSLINNYFWASSVEMLNDPCETIIDTNNFKRQIKTILKIFQKNSAEMDEKYNILCNELDNVTNRDIGIFSLSKTHLDELLWAHYGNSHKGFCIEYELEILTINNSPIKHYPYHVKYTKRPPQVTIRDMQSLKGDLSKSTLLQKYTSTKSKKWINEQEIRIISDKWGKQQYDFRAVKSIFFGLRMSESEKDKIMYELRGRGINYHQIFLEKKAYDFYDLPITDKYSNCKPYLSEIAEVSEIAITESDVQDEYKEFIPYLHYAIEIAKRDPYCKYVNYAEFSATKSKKNNPVIFVNCKKTNNDYANYYYTIEDITEKINHITNWKRLNPSKS